MDAGAERPGEHPTGRPADRVFAPIQVRSGHQAIGRWVAVVAIAVGLAVVKPWAGPNDHAAAFAGSNSSPAPVRAAQATVSSAPSPSASNDADALEVDRLCFGTDIWLVAYVEHWRGRVFRVWRAIEPALTAPGPDDRWIPTMEIVTSGMTELGWCAPAVGPDRPSGSAAVVSWRPSATGSVPMRLTSSLPPGRDSAFVAMYGPPTGSTVAAAASDPPPWPEGRYVFRYRDAAGPDRWFAVVVVARPDAAAIP